MPDEPSKHPAANTKQRAHRRKKRFEKRAVERLVEAKTVTLLWSPRCESHQCEPTADCPSLDSDPDPRRMRSDPIPYDLIPWHVVQVNKINEMVSMKAKTEQKKKLKGASEIPCKGLQV